MTSSGDGVSNRNGVIGDSGVDGVCCSPQRSWRSLSVFLSWIIRSGTFPLLFWSLLNERARANTDGSAKTEGVQESEDRASLK